MDNAQDRVVARYQPGAIEGFDLEEFLRSNNAVPNPLGRPTTYQEKPSLSHSARLESSKRILGPG
jgi:hypothetical protein